MRIAVFQMNAGIDPHANARALETAIHSARDGGASILFTPEMSGLLDRDRRRAAPKLANEREDSVIASVAACAAEVGIWVALGSLALSGERADGRLVNRSLLVGPDGTIKARYDKMHLFDVDLATGESWRESAAYAPGEEAVVVDLGGGQLLGLSVCYDVRFPALYQQLSEAGANILAIPAAFTVPTGKAHWQILLQARAIENAAWVVAAAQTGAHEDGRETWGHSMVIDPWGRVVLDMGREPGLGFAELDLGAVEEARSRVPVIAHRRQVGPARVAA